MAPVNGHAIAGGCVVALCCDHRVVSSNPKLKMGLNEIALGLTFPPATLRICRQRIAREHETEVLVGADLFGLADALRVGLVDEVAEDPLERARARLEVLGRHPRDAYAALKLELRSEALPKPTDIDSIRARLGSWISPALKERLAAVLNRKA